MKPTLLFEGEGWRIVQIELPPNGREPKKPGEPEDDGIRDVIEITDGKDAMGVVRWTRLDVKHGGLGDYNRVCHGLKRELLLRLESEDATHE